MSATVTPSRLLTLEEYAKLPPTDHPTELVRGRIIDMPSPAPLHGYVCTRVIRFLDRFVDANDLGRVMSNDSGVITERDPDTLRGADVAFYSYGRLPRGPLPEGYLEAVPELVFEVLSPSDRWSRVFAKINEYLTAGVQVVVVVNTRTRTATAYRDAQDPQPFPADGELTIPDVLPGFAVPVRQFFE